MSDKKIVSLNKNQPLTNIYNSRLVNGEDPCTTMIHNVHCNMCGGIFDILMQAELDGMGCPTCDNSHVDNTKPAVVYYARVLTEFGTRYVLIVVNGDIASIADIYGSGDKLLMAQSFDCGGCAIGYVTALRSQYSIFFDVSLDQPNQRNIQTFVKDVLGMDHNHETFVKE